MPCRRCGVPASISCPHCKALYQVVKAEAGRESDDSVVRCRACGGPLVGRDGRYVLKYFHLRDASNRRRYGCLWVQVPSGQSRSGQTAGPPDWSPAGEGGEENPKPFSELRSGVGLVHTTDETVEGNETRGGKGPARGDPVQGGEGPDTEPGNPAAEPRAGVGGKSPRPLRKSCSYISTVIPSTPTLACRCHPSWFSPEP